MVYSPGNSRDLIGLMAFDARRSKSNALQYVSICDGPNLFNVLSFVLCTLRKLTLQLADLRIFVIPGTGCCCKLLVPRKE